MIIWQNTDLRHKMNWQFKPTMCKAHSIDPNNVMPMHLSVPEMLWKVNWTGVERWKTKDPETSLASWQCQQTLQRAPNIKHTHPGARTGNLSSLDLQRVRSGNPAVLPPREAHWRPGIQTERQRDGCEDFSQRPAVLELVRMVELGVQLVSDDIGWWW